MHDANSMVQSDCVQISQEAASRARVFKRQLHSTFNSARQTPARPPDQRPRRRWARTGTRPPGTA
jgi:hypothetical protein